uniref:Outer dense fiber protein 3-like n=1 Tax=Kryptolebias marmoratus TaxID=37003 RepID=A0A3Q2ZK86_KRYMA
MTVPDDNVWCGTWRPTKCRGPIAAQYQSPGPKYLLPGLTGACQHDPTKYKAPMYSFNTPGPGAYCPEQVSNISFNRKGPSLLLFFNLLIFFSSQTTLTKAKAPGFSFGLRHSQYILPYIINVDD